MRWAAPAALDGMARSLLRRGVTSFLPTAVTAPVPVAGGVRGGRARLASDGARDGAEPLGFNLEGPFLAESATAPTIRRSSGPRPTHRGPCSSR